MNRFIRISLAAVIGFAAPLQAFGWGTVTGPRGGTATTGPRGAGYAQGPNGASAARGPRGAGYAQGPNGGTLCEARMVALLLSVRMADRVSCARLWPSCLWRSGLCRRRLQAMGGGTLLRCRCRGRGTWHRDRCHNATTATVTSLVLVLVEPSPQPGVLGLLCPLVDGIRRSYGRFIWGNFALTRSPFSRRPVNRFSSSPIEAALRFGSNAEAV